ncbi:hypothetical protein H257_02823 [Aphanomyces astaci]|uniref:Uncharacterized protein n=1 Tax=Aphanomyces astaci TaxID=112090 RepID=W4H023_APHAT|nr:hypothetical protein H257_02823 [Aphanomyces astaci]ETV84926.1 hypothetical protein H257_02823 [Aphanomyces astaci]|eukprot:XP_009824944.1 hypothetical protein H257_02823 [Aphanomyces astaci]
MSSDLAAALGKPPASKDLRRALNVDVYSTLESVPPSSSSSVQSVAAFLVAKQTSHLGGDFLQRPICVTSIGSAPNTSLWTPFLNAYFDVSSFHASAISAFAAPRVRMLQCAVPGLVALNVQQVVDAASRHCPPSSSTMLVLTCEALSATSTPVVVNGKLVLIVSVVQPTSSPQPAVQALLHALGVLPCNFFTCVMNANTGFDITCDIPTFVLCPLCLRKCSLAVPQFNIVRRYESLLVVLEGGGVAEGGSWAMSFHQWCDAHTTYITNNPRPQPLKKPMAAASMAVDVSKLKLLKRRLATRTRR